MHPEENSISIINKNNGQVTGESANALPIRFIGGLSWLQYLIIGMIIMLIVATSFILTVQESVVAVEVSGKSDNVQIFKIQ